MGRKFDHTKFPLHEDAKKLAFLFDSIRERMDELYQSLAVIQDKLKAGGSYKENDQVDLGIITKELEELLDQRRKDSKATKELIEKLLAFQIAQRAAQDPLSDAYAAGRLGKAELDLKKEGAPPKPGTPQYEAFLRQMGVPDEAIASGVIDVSYKGLSAYMTRCAEDGVAMPEGIVQQYDRYRATFRRVRS